MMMLRDADLMSILRKLQEAEAVYMLFHSNQSNLQNQCKLNQIPKSSFLKWEALLLMTYITKECQVAQSNLEEEEALLYIT